MPARRSLLALFVLLAACGDDSGRDDAAATDESVGNAGDGDGDSRADQEGGAVATDDDAPMDIAQPEPDAGMTDPSPPPVDAPIVDEVESDGPFDLETCKDVLFDPETGETDPRCGECCMLRAYTLARFVFEQTCACADRPAFEDASLCGASTDDGACTTCCQDGGFETGSTEGGGCSCSRAPRSDAEVCDAARQEREPLVACEACCLEAGLFGFTYTAGSEGECRCLEPG